MSDSPDVVRALQTVVSYCRVSESIAGEGATLALHPVAIGVARAYKDVADRLEERLSRAMIRPVTDYPIEVRVVEDAEGEPKVLLQMPDGFVVMDAPGARTVAEDLLEAADEVTARGENEKEDRAD